MKASLSLFPFKKTKTLLLLILSASCLSVFGNEYGIKGPKRTTAQIKSDTIKVRDAYSMYCNTSAEFSVEWEDVFQQKKTFYKMTFWVEDSLFIPAGVFEVYEVKKNKHILSYTDSIYFSDRLESVLLVIKTKYDKNGNVTKKEIIDYITKKKSIYDMSFYIINEPQTTSFIGQQSLDKYGNWTYSYTQDNKVYIRRIFKYADKNHPKNYSALEQTISHIKNRRELAINKIEEELRLKQREKIKFFGTIICIIMSCLFLIVLTCKLVRRWHILRHLLILAILFIHFFCFDTFIIEPAKKAETLLDKYISEFFFYTSVLVILWTFIFLKKVLHKMAYNKALGNTFIRLWIVTLTILINFYFFSLLRVEAYWIFAFIFSIIPMRVQFYIITIIMEGRCPKCNEFENVVFLGKSDEGIKTETGSHSIKSTEIVHSGYQTFTERVEYKDTNYRDYWQMYKNNYYCRECNHCWSGSKYKGKYLGRDKRIKTDTTDTTYEW